MRDCPTLAKLLCIWLLPLPLQPIAETHAKPASHVLLSTAINLCLLTAHRSLLLSRSPGVCAGYFIEKSVEEAHAFLTRKMALIESQAQNVQAAAQHKRQNLQGTVDVMNRKIMEMRSGGGGGGGGTSV